MPYNQDGSQDGTEELTDSINKDVFTGTSVYSLLTRVGVGASVQNCGVRNGEFLHLAAPVTVGYAAWFGTGVAWKVVV